LSELVSHGSVATLYQAVKLVEAQALGARQNDAALDLAVFDCYACHHDLKLPASEQPSWREERGYQGVPGRPPMRSWPWTLASAAMANSAPEGRRADWTAGVQSDFNRLLDAFAARPFGDPASMSEAATALVSSLDSMRQAMPHSWNDQRARSFVTDICSAGLARRFADFDQARSIRWALTTLDQERPSLFRDAEPTLRAINTELGLNIAEQPEPLHRLNDYNPVPFQRELEALRKTMSPSAP
jgi:hypothetical protein